MPAADSMAWDGWTNTDAPSGGSVAVGADVRNRWRMGAEARGLVFISAVLTAFGLAVLYSASAFVADAKYANSTFFLVRQLTGAAAGVVAFAIAAKMDADLLRKWAWPIMWFAILTMTAVLVLPESIAPIRNGSRRFLLGGSFQRSEFANLALVVWVSMLVVKKGEALRRFTKGLVPFLVVIGLLAALAALEPDLSVAMLFILLMALILFVGGARMG